MGHNYQNARWIRPRIVAAAVGLAIFAAPVFAQQGAGHASGGQMSAARSMGSGRAVAPARAVGPGRMMGNPIGNGPRTGAIRANSFGARSAPLPTHREIGPNLHRHANPVQGNRNRHHHRRGGFGVGGVGYVGLPYYANSLAFVDADDIGDDDTDQQSQQNAPARQDYAEQAPPPYTEGPPEDGFTAPRAPYAPQGYPPVPPNGGQSNAQSAAAQSDGLDHPAVTLVFNDGRPPEKVNSYVLTGSSVFVAENGHQRVIPVADLNLPATMHRTAKLAWISSCPAQPKAG